MKKAYSGWQIRTPELVNKLKTSRNHELQIIPFLHSKCSSYLEELQQDAFREVWTCFEKRVQELRDNQFQSTISKLIKEVNDSRDMPICLMKSLSADQSNGNFINFLNKALEDKFKSAFSLTEIRGDDNFSADLCCRAIMTSIFGKRIEFDCSQETSDEDSDCPELRVLHKLSDISSLVDWSVSDRRYNLTSVVLIQDFDISNAGQLEQLIRILAHVSSENLKFSIIITGSVSSETIKEMIGTDFHSLATIIDTDISDSKELVHNIFEEFTRECILNGFALSFEKAALTHLSTGSIDSIMRKVFFTLRYLFKSEPLSFLFAENFQSVDEVVKILSTGEVQTNLSLVKFLRARGLHSLLNEDGVDINKLAQYFFEEKTNLLCGQRVSQRLNK